MDELMSEIVPVPEGQIARFGSFELYIDTGELRKHGIRVRLQGKSFQILRALVENPGRVVSREELRTRLWPADTFVDFESGMNTAANRLRSALGDSADSPIYIETLPRIGYRFVAPVTILQAPRNGHKIQLAVPLELEATTTVTPNPQLIAETHDPSADSAVKRRRALLAGLLVLTLTVGSVAFWLLRKSDKSALAFRQVTFKSGAVGSARFTPDGNGIVYSAEWGDDGSRLFQADLANPEPHDLGYRDAWLGGISPSTDLAVFKKPGDGYAMELDQAPLRGGTLQTVVSKGVLSADYGPNRALCLIGIRGREYSLEFPPGKRLYTTNNWITHPRVSPRGDQVAFLEHPIPADDAGDVMVIDTTGRTRTLSTGWASVFGLAWSNSDNEVWFTAAKSGVERQLMSVDMAGHVRQISHTPGTLELEDISKTGKVLLARSTERMSMSLVEPNKNAIQSISRFDWSRVADISADGDSILFDESGEGGGKGYSVHLYHVRSRTFDRLGEGRAMDLSPDGKWAITEPSNSTSTIDLVAVNGTRRLTLPGKGIKYVWVKFLPNNEEILFYGTLPGQPPNLYRQKLPDGAPALVFEDIVMAQPVIDASGQFAIARAPGPSLLLLNLKTGARRMVKINMQVTPVAVVNEKKVVVRVYDRGYLALFELNLTNGTLTPRRRMADPGAPDGMVPMFISNDGNTLVYSRHSVDSDLVIADPGV